MTFDWVELSAAAGRMVNEEPHEVNGDTMIGRTNGPKMSRIQVFSMVFKKSKLLYFSTNTAKN